MNAQTLLRSTRAVRLPIHLGVRAASTSTATTAASPTSNANEKLPLTWPTYLSLRRQRRLWSTLTSIPTTAIGLIAGGGYFGSQEMDPSQLIMGIEPMWVYGGATMGCMALGFLLGPTVGSGLFSLTHPSVSRGNPSPLETMDKELYEHIKRNRVDPRFQSVSNLPPDYYGEKITSLSTYRRWLRDQATYNKKAKHGVPDESL